NGKCHAFVPGPAGEQAVTAAGVLAAVQRAEVGVVERRSVAPTGPGAGVRGKGDGGEQLAAGGSGLRLHRGGVDGRPGGRGPRDSKSADGDDAGHQGGSREPTPQGLIREVGVHRFLLQVVATGFWTRSPARRDEAPWLPHFLWERFAR